MRYPLALAALVIATGAAADPLAEMKQIVQACESQHQSEFQPVIVGQTRNGAWLKQEYVPAVIAYDVRKTDSLVSPFTAYIDITRSFRADRAPTEEAVRALDVSRTELQIMKRRIRFAYQEDKWVVKGGTFTIVGATSDEQSVEALRKNPAIAKCLP